MCWQSRGVETWRRDGSPVRIRTRGDTPDVPSDTVRIGDAERDQVAEQLKRHCVDGRLTLDEYADRLDEVYAARTAGDLARTLRELPGPVPAAVRPRGQLSLPRLAAPIRSYLIVMAVLVTVWALTSPGGYFWPMWPALGWGFALLRHGAGCGRPVDRIPRGMELPRRGDAAATDPGALLTPSRSSRP